MQADATNSSRDGVATDSRDIDPDRFQALARRGRIYMALYSAFIVGSSLFGVGGAFLAEQSILLPAFQLVVASLLAYGLIKGMPGIRRIVLFFLFLRAAFGLLPLFLVAMQGANETATLIDAVVSVVFCTLAILLLTVVPSVRAHFDRGAAEKPSEETFS